MARPLKHWSAYTDVPPPEDTPVERLRHTLLHMTSAEDDRYAIEATLNVYGEGVKTGLTYGDLRAILVTLSLAPVDVCSIPISSETCW